MFKIIKTKHKHLSGHSAVSDAHKTEEDNSLNRSNSWFNDSSRESDHNDEHVIKSKRILRNTKHKEITGNVFDDLLSEDKNITSTRSIENANESKDSLERSIKKSRLNIFKKKRLSLLGSMVQKAIEDDDTMEESNEQNVTAENDPASNANNLSMSPAPMTQTLHSKMNNSENNSFNSKTKEQTPSQLKSQLNTSESLNRSNTLNPMIILTHSPEIDNLVSEIGSRLLIDQGSDNRPYQEQNSEHKDMSKKVLNKKTVDESQDHSKSKNMNRSARQINKTNPTTPQRQTRSSHSSMYISHIEKTDFSTGSDADNSLSESGNPSIAKRKALTAGRRTRSTASLNRINESYRLNMNQSQNVERFRMIRSQSKSNIQDSPKSIKRLHMSFLNLRNKSPEKTEETIENVENDKSRKNVQFLLSSKKSISQNQNSTESESLENLATESKDMRHSIENNQINSKISEESLNRDSESPISPSQISSPKKSITHNKDDSKNDETKSDENDLPKSKPNFLRKLHKSLAADVFDNILSSKSIKDSNTNMTSDKSPTEVPRDNNSPVSNTTKRSDVDFCPDTPSISNLGMIPISQSTPYNKKIVPSTPSPMKRISNENFVNESINNIVKRPTIISSVTSNFKISRTTKKQIILNENADQASTQILQDKDKMAEIKKTLDNIKKRELEKIDRYLTKIPSDRINKPTIPNERPFQLTNKESIKKPKQVDKAYIVNGRVYKRPKLPRPKSWATNRLYQYLWKRLEPKYKLNTRVRSEKFIIMLADVVSLTIRRKKYNNYIKEIEVLMKEMARLEIIKTRNDFYDFCYEFLPYEFRVKATPILLPGNVMSIPYDPELLHTPILNE
ncbi:GATA zinc finger domain-containing protein 14 [Cephus cinctus]|uniref:GATA zinc finger domain-containing protein 14 n=1 Tax=Cephus cinctus TaxID=211228 RepID=A0AAJ7FDY3_CEPCN|nr:GATA zinc finger domain-containing protein 14 [Cephus cinctus]